MAAVILGWDPRGRDRWDYRTVVEQVAESGRFLDQWSAGPAAGLAPGTQVWLLLQGPTEAGTGLLGHAEVTTAPFDTPAAAPGTAGRCIGLAFDSLLPWGEQIRPDTLRAAVPGVQWDAAARNACTAVPAEAEPALRGLWREQGPAPAGPHEVVPGTFPPNAVTSIDVSRYERDADARRVCVAFHGTACAACGFSFEAAYGDAGAGFIQVHHLVPPELLEGAYTLDPVADLVPLCPNCHAMAHAGVASPRTVSELRTIIAAAGHLRGEVVSEQAIQAQADARRILEGPDTRESP